MSSKPTSVFAALFGKARQIQYSDFVLVEHPMNGAFASPAMAFRSAQSWASQARSSGNAYRDKQQFLSRLPVVVASKSGTLAASKGGAQQIEQLAKSMLGAGFDLSGWDVPQSMLKPAKKPARHAEPATETTVEAPAATVEMVKTAEVVTLPRPQDEPETIVVKVDFRNRRRA